MNASMTIALVTTREAARTHLTGVRLLTCVSSRVSGQVITHLTGVRLLTCVRSRVSGQVITPAERTAAD